MGKEQGKSLTISLTMMFNAECIDLSPDSMWEARLLNIQLDAGEDGDVTYCTTSGILNPKAAANALYVERC